MKKFTLSDDRIVIVEKLEGCLTVIVKQKDSDVKFAEFILNRCVVLIVLLLLLLFVYNAFIVSDLCLCRWAQLRMIIDEIETNIEALRINHPVSYKTHIGADTTSISHRDSTALTSASSTFHAARPTPNQRDVV